jgi:transcriptional regulator with XRE-family HTH domain
MNLGEKIFKLRKEKGLSQEALAEQIGTPRQAVSKWENNQGYPETERLLQLSNVFEVSVDFLLKDEKSTKSNNEKGFYVSREMARGYLANEKRIGKYLGLCFMFWAFAGIPYVMFATSPSWRFLGIAVCVVAGISFAVLGIFTEKQDYKSLKEEPLLFDYDILKELTAEYNLIKRKILVILVPCTILFVVGIICIVLTIREYIEWSQYHSFVFLGFGIGLLGFIVSINMIELCSIISVLTWLLFRKAFLVHSYML